MSYEIVYDRRFIRSPLGITPMILAGSNNCYEPMPNGRERRERSWSPLFNEPTIPEEALMARVQGCCGGQFQEHFKWHGKFVDDAGFVAFVRNGVKGTLTLEELAAILHLSVRQTQRLLQRNFGKTFSQKLNEARIAAAAQLLLNTGLSVTEIGERTGFSSIEHFSSSFRRFTGVSPTQYRKNHP